MERIFLPKPSLVGDLVLYTHEDHKFLLETIKHLAKLAAEGGTPVSVGYNGSVAENSFAKVPKY